jgi:short-subunit dehydrogenase
MESSIIKGKVALVTGASSGLGVDFADELARGGCNLVLVARREEQLRAVQERIVAAHGVMVEVLPADLSRPEAPQALYDELQRRGISVDVLVNNAGFGVYGNFADVPWEREQSMLMVDILAVTHLTKLFLPGMLQRDFGFILMVASVGAYQPSPTYASYSAAKSYVLSLGEALNYELRKTGVSCTVVSPGVAATEFLSTAGQKPTLYQRTMMMQSADVARIGIRSMLQRRPSVVTGLANSLLAFSNRLVPRRWSVAMTNWFMTMK